MLYLLQNPTPTPTHQNPQILDWGIAIAILFYILKESIAFFKSKDASEAALTNQLINDLRGDRQQQMQQMAKLLLEIKASNQQMAGANIQISRAIHEINLAIQQGKRSDSEIFAAIRSLERKFEAIAATIEPQTTRTVKNGKSDSP